jgi:RNA polymerase sigma-70 factor (ECF subfamily)
VQGDDAELTAAVRAAQEGDECAFRTVYRAVHPRLLGYVRTLVHDADAEDVTSEAWLQIARDLQRFSGDADRFRGWAARTPPTRRWRRWAPTVRWRWSPGCRATRRRP